jgi:predicted ATPase/class 3 adenylate cyclase
MAGSSGIVTFLFTDIEGSTRLWQQDETAMRLALSRHDELLRKVVADHDGRVFAAMGDGMAAAFGSAAAAVNAALAAQRSLAAELWPTAIPLRVRMGLHTGEAEGRDGDYFGTVVNRAARLMAIGYGGQVLCSAATVELVGDGEFAFSDLGQHRLRDLDRPMHVFQAGGGSFPALGSLDRLPGNLPEQVTSFVGRQREVAELIGLVGAHRLVTLTGPGGVGKTRLAVQVAAELAVAFDDGVWLVELAPVGDPAAVAAAVATTLGVTPQAGSSVADSVAAALSGRQMLVVLDNCEHLLDAVADVVEAILARTTAVKVLATSREGLRAAGEQLWPVPSLDVRAGANSAAVELFVERARAVAPGFGLADPHDAAAVIEICQRLDGIALAIELAAARMVSMNPAEVRDRLGDRFRLLSGPRRGLERHQTLRHAVGWSYDLLGDDERTVLTRCAVFVGGFDLAAAAVVVSPDSGDEYDLLDVVDSLVRKSLVTAEQVSGHTRFGMSETIRQFAEEQLAATGTIGDIRNRHARYFAQHAVAYWGMWDGPGQRMAVDWMDVEFANLRAGFRWAADQHDLATAAAIAAHTAMLGQTLQRYEPVGWAEEILEAARAAELAQLPRLYTAASFCMYTGRPEAAVGYTQAALALGAVNRYDGFDPAWTSYREGVAHMLVGRWDRHMEICAGLAAGSGPSHVMGRCGLLYALEAAGRVEEATAIAEDTLTAASAHGNPFFVAMAMLGSGRAFALADPARALRLLRDGLVYAQQHRLPFFESNMAGVTALLEAVHGDLGQALSLFDAALDSLHLAGNVVLAGTTLGYLAVCFDRLDRHDIAATIYGASTHHPVFEGHIDLPAVVDHLRAALGPAAFDQCAATGAAMDLTEAVGYARHHIQLARLQAADPDSGRTKSPLADPTIGREKRK